MKKEEQFNDLIKENGDRIMRICRYYSPDQATSQDLYQDVLLNAWKSLDRFRGESAISTWVYRIAVNTCLTHLGKRIKYSGMNVYADINMIKAFADDSGYEEKVLLEKQSEALHYELNMLSVIDKALISLVLEGLSMREISDVIGITETNVRTKICRIKSELKNKLTIDSNEK